MTNSYTNSRPTGKIEKFFYGLTKSELFNNFNSALDLDHEIDFNEHRAALCKTIAKMVQEYPLLLCNVFGAGSEIAVVDKLNFEDVVEFWYAKDNGIEDTLAKLDQIRFTYDAKDQVLFKIIVSNGKTVHFVFDHALYDGRSSAAFAYLFLDLLNESALSEDATADNSVVFTRDPEWHYTLPPPIEEMCDLLGPFDIPSGEQPQPWKSDKAYARSHHHFKSILFSSEESAKIKEICKSKGDVSLSVYFQYCFVLAQQQVWPEAFNDLSKIHDITFGVDVRKFIKPQFSNEKYLFGSNSTGSMVYIPTPTALDWDFITSESTKLFAKVRDGSITYPFGGFVVGQDIDWTVAHRAQSILEVAPNRSNLMFTNLGYQANPPQREGNKWNSTRVYFSQSTHNLSYMVATNFIADSNGMTVVNSMVHNEMFTESDFSRFNDAYRAVLLQL